jgi:hypothetical protein
MMARRAVTLTLDGTFYDVWYVQGLNNLQLSVYDEEAEANAVSGRFDLVRGLNFLRLQIRSMPSELARPQLGK